MDRVSFNWMMDLHEYWANWIALMKSILNIVRKWASL